MGHQIRIDPPLPDEQHSQYAYRNLRRNIMEFHLKPGEQLKEGVLAAAMGISRTPVHEAVLALRDEKLIDVVPRRESRVSQINMALVNEGIFLRSTVEPALLRGLAGNVAPTFLQRMQDNLTQQNQLFHSGDDLSALYPMDDEFHQLLYLAANKPQIYAAVRTLCAHLDRLRFFVRLENDTDIEAMSLEEHRQMLLYLMLGASPQTDLDALLRLHILRFQTKMPAYLARYQAYFTLGNEDGAASGVPAFAQTEET